ncbi:MAG: 16S rRNA (guanine(527)-N(7))-methyltransferase RsmG [Ruminococcus sp.]|nr:16S rRNA (guanine(527)-N(7))-methyltransferase RsmG [Ruminococcus sp.]
MLPEFELCCSEFQKYGLNLTHEMYAKYDKYADFLVEYNKNVNLTAITDPAGILVKHFIDSVIALKYVDIPENSTLIDVGTGAGFPSVPIKIYRPDIKVTLLDSLNKRITFLECLCNLIGIDAECVHGRAEDIAKLPEYREKFDFSCARAVANLSVLSEYCMPFVSIGGAFISLKGPNESAVDSENAIKILGGSVSRETIYNVGQEERKIIVIKKISQTPSKYPRNSSQIKKKTL